MSILFFSKEHDDTSPMVAQLRARLPDHTFECWPTCRDPATVRYAIVWGPPKEFFSGLDNLRGIVSMAAGVDHLLQHPGLPTGVPMVRLTDAGMADKIGEYVHYGVLRAQRHFLHYEQLQAKKVWQPQTDVHASDFQVGILGMGVIGTRVAERLQANGYAVKGWRRQQRSDTAMACFAGEAGLTNFLTDLNVLVCTLPLTKDTRNIVDRSLLAQLPVGSHFINVARGGHVVEADLIQALDSNHIASALLDVCSVEPAAEDHPFWQHAKVSLTPHISGPTQTAQSIEQISTAIAALEANQKPQGLVDTAAGY